MPITSNGSLFTPPVLASGKIDSSLIEEMNRSSLLQALFAVLESTETKIILGDPKGGTFFIGPRIFVDPNDFTNPDIATDKNRG